MRFDVPLLIQKGAEYGIKSIGELNKLWHNTYTIDLFEVTLPLRHMRFRGHNLGNLVKKAKSCGLNVPEPYGAGKDVTRLYKERKYEEIEKHLRRDLEITRAIDLQMKKLVKLYCSL